MADPAMDPLAAADSFAHGPPRRRMSGARHTMADETRWRSAETSGVDADTCRICRGEATPDEPLFYPCKCSGSIKYVHQDCLMEWLSHSQKKHCELCKTPFRFTKLYSPKMPTTLPVHVFVGHVAKYIFRNLVVWCRAALVVTVWLCWLPWLMRSVWSFLFWLSDEGLGSGPLWGSDTGTTHALRPRSDTCPANPLLDENVDQILRSFSASPYTGTWRGINITTNDTITSALIRAALSSWSAAGLDSELTCPVDAKPPSPAASTSLLGNFAFLNNLSRYAIINRSVIDILEGQVITVLVIICFILVILVRDYVVQQQPEINMRAAFAANENQPAPGPQNDEQRDRAEAVENLRGPDDDVEQDVEDNRVYAEADTVEPPAEASGQARDPPTEAVEPDDNSESRRVDDRPDSAQNPAAPAAPGPATAGLQDYLRIFRQADGDFEKILETIREENLEDNLAHWVRMTRAMLDNQEAAKKRGDGNDPGASAAHGAPIQPRTSPQRSNDPAEPPAPQFAQPVSEPQESELNSDEGDTREFKDKGKGKALLRDDESEEDGSASQVPTYSTSHFNSSRPRAVSDGPQRTDTVNPLANNNWSFPALPPDPSRATGSARTNDEASPPNAELSRLAGYSGDNAQVLDDLSTIASDIASAQASLRAAANAQQVAEHDETDANRPTTGQGDVEGPVNDPSTPGSAPATDAAVAHDPRLQRGMMDLLADFMWADIQAQDEDAVLQPDDDEVDEIQGPFDFPEDDGDDEFEDVPDGEDDDFDERDPEVVEAAVAAGLDPEAMDEAEDIEGVLELIGMRGPLVGLFQNAVFCAVLVSVTIFVCVFLPYNIGRMSVWGAMNPVRVLNILFSFTTFIQDIAVSLLAATSSGFLALMYYVGTAFGWWLPSAKQNCHALMVYTWHVSANSSTRVAGTLTSDFPIPSSVDIKTFSAVSHQALISLKECVAAFFVGIGDALGMLVDGELPSRIKVFLPWAASYKTAILTAIRELPATLLNPASWVISFGVPETSAAIPLELAAWSGADRFWAILCGYLSVSGLSAMYLRRGAPLSHGEVAQEWEASLIDILNQASGVMKVILIISIEMLVFPLYCGLLLDVALLPLLEGATLRSRLDFTLSYPLTSIFVHWFVGTGYMFHFALFVSMCRKIMRKGVLYFIRDPDDPEFHPIRDVLERNVMTQLRKILFSAFVYGALVIVCLGGVVWGLSLATTDVLPIHYSSNEPVLEFPIDLLFYNFAMPLAVKFFKPSDGLHAMYTWWLRKCARFLRLTWFLFGERRIDEEGQLALGVKSPHLELPWWRRCLLEVNERNEVVPKTWTDTFEGGTAKPTSTISTDKMRGMKLQKRQLVQSGQLVRDGRFVRTPASDQVKIPKGRRVFIPVDEDDTRLDEAPVARDVYSSGQYQLVYLPPHFGVRIFLFILFIWIFAAVTGVLFTIVPLVFGRRMFNVLLPEHVRTNDIYAFSMGIYILGSVGYFLFHMRSVAGQVGEWASSGLSALQTSGAAGRLATLVSRGLRVAYSYTMLLVVCPVILTTLMELYVVIPLHTYINPPSPASPPSVAAMSAGFSADANLPGATGTVVDGTADPPHQHTARVIQSWTLGLLYVKLGARAITTFYPRTRAAAAVRAVLRRGWLDPDASVLTRAFVVPGVVVGAAAIFGPAWATRFVLERRGIVGPGAGSPPAPHEITALYRLSYPVTAFGLLGFALLWSVARVFDSWKVRIRDEAYLIGERLHNFGVVTAGAGAGSKQAAGGGNDAREQWRVRGQRI